MATHNPITGDALVSRVINNNYADNYDRIFRKKKNELPEQETTGASETSAVPELREERRDDLRGTQQPE